MTGQENSPGGPIPLPPGRRVPPRIGGFKAANFKPPEKKKLQPPPEPTTAIPVVESLWSPIRKERSHYSQLPALQPRPRKALQVAAVAPPITPAGPSESSVSQNEETPVRKETVTPQISGNEERAARRSPSPASNSSSIFGALTSERERELEEKCKKKSEQEPPTVSAEPPKVWKKQPPRVSRQQKYETIPEEQEEEEEAHEPTNNEGIGGETLVDIDVALNSVSLFNNQPGLSLLGQQQNNMDVSPNGQANDLNELREILHNMGNGMNASGWRAKEAQMDLEVSVPWIESIHKFAVFPRKYKAAYDEQQRTCSMFGRGPFVKEDDILPGNNYIVQIKSGEWHRVRVYEHHKRPAAFSLDDAVYLPDMSKFCSSQTLPLSSHVFAFQCSLYCIKPRHGNKWNAKAIDFFSRLIKNAQSIELPLLAEADWPCQDELNQLGVTVNLPDILIDGESVSERLVNEGYAEWDC